MLLSNLLDGFDRLYDKESRVVDTCALLEATANAMSASDLAEDMATVAKAVRRIVTSGEPEVESNREALAAIQPLREKVAARWAEGWTEFVAAVSRPR